MADISEALAIAIGHHQVGRLAEAEQIYRQILAVEPECARAWHLMGIIAFEAGRFDAAIELSSRALQLQPGVAEIYNNLGNALKALGRRDEAAECFREAIRVNPNFAEGHYNLGLMLGEGGNRSQATMCYQKALELRPNLVEAHNNLGKALHEADRPDEAVAYFRRTIELRPGVAEFHHNLGLALYDQLKLNEARQCFHRALELKPDFVEAHGNLSHSMLLTGDLENGWLEYEWRWESDQLPKREFREPRWRGEPLTGKTILLHAEQGFGDTFQFIRYAALLKEQGANVVAECQRAIVKLLARCQAIDRVVALGDELPGFDTFSPLLSLPGVLRTSLERIPVGVPYLFADSDLISAWWERLKGLSGYRVGINWQGREGRGAFRLRDIPIESFAPLTQLPGLRLISLQKGEGRKELTGAGFPIFDPGDDVDTDHGGFMDTAAIIKNVDLVITSDTAVAHLAGALGVPVWVALPFVPDWRWLLDRSDSPWYPTMRLFRQRRSGDWLDVFSQITAALRDLVRKQ